MEKSQNVWTKNAFTPKFFVNFTSFALKVKEYTLYIY